MKNSNQSIEKVSLIIHEMWMHWASNLLKTEPAISKIRKDRWIKECFVPYEELTIEMKELDRSFAKKIIKSLRIEIEK